MGSTTFVTGIWNLRIWDYKKEAAKLLKLIDTDTYMCIYIDPQDESFIWEYRNKANTKLYYKKLDDFKKWFEFYDQIEALSYNIHSPIMMSKMFLLNDIKLLNPFNTSHFIWLDPSFTSYKLNQIKSLQNYTESTNQFITFNYPVYQTLDARGIKTNKLAAYCTTDESTFRISSGKLFGGYSQAISQINDLYYHYLKESLNSDIITDSEEWILTIISHKHNNIVNSLILEDCNSIPQLLETLKPNINELPKSFDKLKTNLYILTYNFPEQLKHLLNSFEASDPNFLTKTCKYLINNSTDSQTFDKYDKICEKYGFTQIKKNNIGICGGRQFIAEHFDETRADYYIFFEDDMLLHNKKANDDICKTGLIYWTNNLYDKTLNIIHKEGYDFLKLSFMEVYGGNEIQWAWYNVPDDIRQKYFPDKIIKPLISLDPDPPLTTFKNIKRYQDINYIEGEVYYCNWPMWFSRKGNRKVFLDNKLAHPYEQTWMSQVFQKQKENLFSVAVLLMSPINHDRILYYKDSERREN